MSILEIETGVGLPFVRRYATTLDVGDGRTIIGRCVPYDVPATVVDPASPAPYSEVVRHGAFRRSVKAPNRVLLRYEHLRDLPNVIGRAVELVEHDDGLHGTFRAVDGNIGDHALELIRAGFVTGLSVEAVIHPNGTRLRDGLVERTLLLLDHVALTSSPAYDGAEITAVRSGSPPVEIAPAITAALAISAELRARYGR